MATCHKCRHYFRTLEDEEGMHECPKCGWDGQEEPTTSDAETGEAEDIAAFPLSEAEREADRVIEDREAKDAWDRLWRE